MQILCAALIQYILSIQHVDLNVLVLENSASMNITHVKKYAQAHILWPWVEGLTCALLSTLHTLF